MPTQFSFIVPFHQGLPALARCLNALHPLPPDTELIIASDGAVDDCSELAARYSARLISMDGPSGPATARNAAAAAAAGDVLVFVDADVAVDRPALTRIQAIFREQPQTAAVFGSYDEEPADPGFMSQYKNLSHSFIHRSSETRARTFWAGFGAVRREAFEHVRGFDERFARPSVEDIDLGYRLNAAGYQVVLDKSLSACHLKRWTVRSAILCDVRDRGIPWTQLILRYGALANDLNLRLEYRLSVVLSYLLLASLWPWGDLQSLAAIPVIVVGLTVLNQRYYRFFYRKRGAAFAVRVWTLHTIHHLYNGVSFAIGVVLFVAARYCCLRLPGALACQSWNETTAGPAAPAESVPVWSPDPAGP